jgi:hypothetical protein
MMRISDRTTLRRSFILVLALAVIPRDVRAQDVPLVAGDLTVGSGATSTHVGATWFRSTTAAMVNADLAIRLGGSGTTRAVLVLGYSIDAAPSDQADDCPLAPNGTCKSYFPNTFGPSVGVGLRQALGSGGLLGATVGVASYSGQAAFAEADASWRFAPHLAVLAEFRYVNMAFSGQRVWFDPLSAGVRLYW